MNRKNNKWTRWSENFFDQLLTNNIIEIIIVEEFQNYDIRGMVSN